MKRVFTGASGGRRGYLGGFGTGGITPVEFLGVVANQAAMLLLVGDKGDWCIRSDTNTVFVVIDTPSSIIGNWHELAYPIDPAKVLSDATDPTPGYLDAKVDGKTILEDATLHKIGVNKQIGVIPIITIFDNTAALPLVPAAGDRYIALVTANGWTIDNIYEYNGVSWVETVTVDGMTVYNRFQGAYYIYTGGAWFNLLSLAPGFPVVKADAADGIPGYLNAKVDNSTIEVTAAHVLALKALGITDAKVAVANKDGAAGTPSMRTIGNGALQACAGNDGRLSDPRTPTAHAASHNLGGADIITTIPRYLFFADQVLTPNNADWAVNAAAGMSADSLNNALLNRQFDDTTEEGIGVFIEIPAGAVNMTFYFRSRAQTAPGAATTVLPRLYRRQIVDNTVVGAWSALFAFAQIDIPTNTRYQYDSETVALATLGLAAGNVVQLELTRNPADGLVGDWNLLEMRIYFG
jgi:hypothetical protein